ncbi:MAG: hypothetical protein B7Z66_10055 [Chromatiales bacterium 21-64-14]|nr:MAG: hypothetical protein B7Z66_10055 [Chromatiales bacterium 21-64-14]HQU16199.1 twin transmembrane helix small protein [Gammaproteobacteria bacterium]
MIVKLLIVAGLLTVIASLASAMFYLVKDKGQSNRTLKALTVRISLSLVLFFLLFVAWAAGLIHPHGIYPQRPSTQQSSKP